MSVPLVSVVIPVFNRAHFIGDAVRSVLRQTLGDFEVVVVDDGSTDDTLAVAEAIGDARVRIVSHAGNRGLPAARNTGLDEARGEFIAWLDSDDLCRPERLARQVAFLRANAEVAMTGCCAGKIGEDGTPRSGTRVPPLAAGDIAAWLLFRSAFQKSSVMGRAAILKQYRYFTGSRVCEDIDQYLRLIESHALCNMPEVLIDRRVHDDQMVRVLKTAIRDRKAALIGPALAKLGMTFGEDDLRRHLALSRGKDAEVGGDAAYVDWAEEWLLRLRGANASSRRLDDKGLALATGFFWMQVCKAAIPRLGVGPATTRFFISALAYGLLSAHGAKWLRHVAPLSLREG